jgi:hypothetical protein
MGGYGRLSHQAPMGEDIPVVFVVVIVVVVE